MRRYYFRKGASWFICLYTQVSLSFVLGLFDKGVQEYALERLLIYS
jgi:hypothetical protein